MKNRVVIVRTYRTPFYRVGGKLKDISAKALAANCINKIFEENYRKYKEPIPELIVLGQAIQANDEQNPARTLLRNFEEGYSNIPSYTINSACASSITALQIGFDNIKNGRCSSVIVGGMENMSMHKQFLADGLKPPLNDNMIHDMLTSYEIVRQTRSLNVFNDIYNNGLKLIDLDISKLYKKELTENEYSKLNILPIPTEKVLDHNKDIHNLSNYNGELLKYDYWRKSDSCDDVNELSKKINIGKEYEDILDLRRGSVCNNADGACVMQLMSLKQAKKLNMDIIAEIVDVDLSSTSLKNPINSIFVPTIRSILNLLDRNQVKINDIDVWEINEAFSLLVHFIQRILHITAPINIHGGALQIGHPLAASGARIVQNIALDLKNNDNQFNLGVASLCVGGSMGASVLLKKFK